MKQLLLIIMFTVPTFVFAQSSGCVEGDCIDGWGIYIYEDSSVYKGFFKESLRDGYGLHNFANGDIYQGEWDDDRPHGTGVYVYDGNEMRYVGEWKNGERAGYGIIRSHYVDQKVSEWKDDGLDTDKKFFPGCVMGNCENGYGEYVWVDGSRYKGMYADGRRDGLGTYYYPKGGKYEGIQRKGKRTGIGVYYYPSGKKFVGDWFNEFKNGEGILFNNGKIEKQGVWLENRFVEESEVRDEIKELAQILQPGMNYGLSSGVMVQSRSKSAEPKNDLPSLPTRFADVIKTHNVDDVIQLIKPDYKKSEEDLFVLKDRIDSQFEMYETQYGDVMSVEQIETKDVTTTIKSNRFILNYSKRPVLMSVIYYKSHLGWEIQDITWSEKIEDMVD